jgi:hypothetical protein
VGTHVRVKDIREVMLQVDHHFHTEAVVAEVRKRDYQVIILWVDL